MRKISLAEAKANTAARRPAPKPTRTALPLATCAHLGPRVPGQPCGSQLMRCTLHGGTTTRFVKCSGADRHCPTCADNTTAAPPAGRIVVPQPPALDLRPRSKLAVVTVVVGDESRACFAASGPHMRRYAESVGADLVVLDWPGHPAWPMSSKFAVARVLDHYERIAYVDADVLLRPGCVDLFEMCAPDEFGLVDELQHHRQNPRFNRERNYQRFRSEMGFARVEHLPWMANCGVMVVPRAHRELLLPPVGSIAPDHCAEQDHTNARLLDSGLPYRLLDRRANWQNWTDHGFRAAPADAVLHWSGAGTGRVTRAEQIGEWAARFPWPARFDPPEPSHPEWEIDRRHLLWMADVLTSGRFHRVLEIGSYRGYSTRAFLHALQIGAADEVHLCDTAPTPALERLVAESGVADRVTVHRCPSIELLARDARWDFVFVDGDHRGEVVAEEARLLLAARVPLVFAHDTSAHPRYPDCDGPALLAAAFWNAGYLCDEDNRARAGEGTDRGMLCASLGRESQSVAFAAYRSRCGESP